MLKENKILYDRKSLLTKCFDLREHRNRALSLPACPALCNVSFHHLLSICTSLSVPSQYVLSASPSTTISLIQLAYSLSGLLYLVYVVTTYSYKKLFPFFSISLLLLHLLLFKMIDRQADALVEHLDLSSGMRAVVVFKAAIITLNV